MKIKNYLISQQNYYNQNRIKNKPKAYQYKVTTKIKIN